MQLSNESLGSPQLNESLFEVEREQAGRQIDEKAGRQAAVAVAVPESALCRVADHRLAGWLTPGGWVVCMHVCRAGRGQAVAAG